MGLGEADTRAKLIDPAIHGRDWTEDLIRREETAGAIDVVDGKPRRQSKGRVDCLLRVKVNPDTQPVLAILEAKAEALPPTHGLEQVKAYAACKRLNVPFAFSSNGHLFVEYDRTSGKTARPRPLTEFPTPADLRARYEAAVGFSLTDPVARPLLARYPGGERYAPWDIEGIRWTSRAAVTTRRSFGNCWRRLRGECPTTTSQSSAAGSYGRTVMSEPTQKIEPQDPRISESFIRVRRKGLLPIFVPG